MPLFSAIIAFCSVFAGLGLIFRILLDPVKKDVKELKQGQKNLSAEQKELNLRMDRIESKLDQLIAKQA